MCAAPWLRGEGEATWVQLTYGYTQPWTSVTWGSAARSPSGAAAFAIPAAAAGSPRAGLRLQELWIWPWLKIVLGWLRNNQED